MPLSDGGEGLLDVFPGSLEETWVRGPLGEETVAKWRFLSTRSGEPPTAVIEMAQASGLELVGGASRNQPMLASTVGTGELILAALDRGATRIVVGCGGSATTDGGGGVVKLLEGDTRLEGVTLIAACDVTTRFVDAARVFASQKGADERTIQLLTERLEGLADEYVARFGVDVREIPGAGAAGGLAGGLVALGATLRSGFDLVAELLGFARAARDATLVVSGEGCLDATSFDGKVIGKVLETTSGHTPVLLVVGQMRDEARKLVGSTDVLSLQARYGAARAMSHTIELVESIVHDWLLEHPLD